MGYDKPSQNTKAGDKVGYDTKEGRFGGKVQKVKPGGKVVVKDGVGNLKEKKKSDLYK